MISAVDVGLMLLSAVLNAGIHPVVAMIVVTGVVPLAAIVTVTRASRNSSRPAE